MVGGDIKLLLLYVATIKILTENLAIFIYDLVVFSLFVAIFIMHFSIIPPIHAARFVEFLWGKFCKINNFLYIKMHGRKFYERGKVWNLYAWDQANFISVTFDSSRNKSKNLSMWVLVLKKIVLEFEPWVLCGPTKKENCAKEKFFNSRIRTFFLSNISLKFLSFLTFYGSSAN